MPNARTASAAPAPQPLRFLRIRQVIDLTGHSRSAVYLLMRNGEFPAPVKTGKRSIAWVEQEVLEHMQARIAASRAFAA